MAGVLMFALRESGQVLVDHETPAGGTRTTLGRTIGLSLGLTSAWLLRWPQGVDDQGRRFDRRIDHVFVSPRTAIRDAQYITDPESDHPALVVEIR